MNREACIQTYCRLAPVLPSPAPVPTLRIAVEDHGTGRSTLVAADPVTGACTSLGCAGVLRPTASQLEVFETVARPLLERVLFDDEKCAVLAYGQTASGKTHTVLGPKGGSPEFFGDDALCGLLPRAVDYFFSVSSSAQGSVMPRSSLPSAPGDRHRHNGGGNYGDDSYGMDGDSEVGRGGGQGQGQADDDGEPLLCDGVEISAVEIYNETATDLVAKCHVDATIAAAANSSKKNSGGAGGGGGGVRGRSPSTSASFSSLASSATSSFASYRGGSRDSSPTNRGHGGSSNTGPGSQPHVQVQYKATEKGKLLRSVRQARCRTLTDAHETIAALCRSRCTAATDANSVSSRSHVVVQVTPLLRPTGAAVSRRAGTATFVDLAGSECLKNLRDGGSSTSAADEFDADGVAASHRITGGAFAGTGPRGGGGIGGGSGVLQEMHETSRREQRQRETRRINVSLLALKKVVHALHRGAAFVPFMESLLTVVLEPCLGRHAAALVACCSPRIVDSAETLETLRFAAEASKIRARPQSSARLAVERSLARAVKSRDRVASAAASAARKKGGHGAFELVDDDDVCSPARPGHGDDFGAGSGSKLQKEADHMVMVYGSPERYESPSPGHGPGDRRGGGPSHRQTDRFEDDSCLDYDGEDLGEGSEVQDDDGSFGRFEREAFADIVRHSGGHAPAPAPQGSRIQRRQPGERDGAAPHAQTQSVQMAPESLPSPPTPGAPASAQLTVPSSGSGRLVGPASQGPQGPRGPSGPTAVQQDATHRLFAAEDAGRLRRENTELKIELSSVRRELEDGRAAAARLLAQCSRLAEGVSVMEGERNEALDSLHRERAENANAIANAKAEAGAAIAKAEETAAKAPAPHTPSSPLIATPLFATPASKTSAEDQHHQNFSSLSAAHVEEMARMKSAMTALAAEKADAVSALEKERQVSAALRRDVAALQAMLGHDEDPRHTSDGASKDRHHDHSRSHVKSKNDVENVVKKEQHVASAVQRGDTSSSVAPSVPSPSAHPPQPARPTLAVANDDASVVDDAPPSLLDLSRSSAAPSSVPSSAAHRRRDDGSRGFVRRDRERSLSPSGEGHHYFREPEHRSYEPDMEDRRGAAQNANDKTFGLEDLAACVEGTAGGARRRSPSPSGEGHHYFQEPMPSTLTSTSAATRTMLMQPSTNAPKAALATTAGPAFDLYVDPQSERSMATPLTSQHRDSQPSSAAVNNGSHHDRTQDREHGQQTLQQRSVNEMNQRSSTKPTAPMPQEKPAPKRYGGSAAAMERMLLLERLRKSSTVSDLMAHDRCDAETKDDDSSAARKAVSAVHIGHRTDGREAHSRSLLARVTDSEADDETAGGEVDLSAASSCSLLVGETPGKERPTFSI